jgi:hypothetical protein
MRQGKCQLYTSILTQLSSILLQPHFEGSVKLPLTIPKMGLGSPPRFPKTQKSIAGVTTPRIDLCYWKGLEV